MSDLVERLKAPMPRHLFFPIADALCMEAAAEITRLQKELDTARDEAADNLRMRTEDLRAELAEAREDALEEAARLIDDTPCRGPCYAHYDELARRIRELSGTLTLQASLGRWTPPPEGDRPEGFECIALIPVRWQRSLVHPDAFEWGATDYGLTVEGMALGWAPMIRSLKDKEVAG